MLRHNPRSQVPAFFVLVLLATACDRPAPTAALGTAPNASDNLSTSSNLFGLGGPIRPLNVDQRRLFDRGRVVFVNTFTPAAGLGPLFNASSCAECHGLPVVGGEGTQVETHMTAFANGTCDALEEVGGQVVQDSATPALQGFGVSREPAIPGASGAGHRTTPSLLGFGLLEAIPDQEILEHADPNDANGDGISGRASIEADGRVDRFGKKDVAPTLDAFLADAFIYEMGITDSVEPVEQTIAGQPLPPGVDPAPDPEISQDDFRAAVAFVRYLAPPRTGGFGFGDREGRTLFTRVGCASCHLPALFTGSQAPPPLANRIVFAYSDLLLHDMGPGLADICLGNATPAEFRTEPLMGIRFKTAYLHDGRATTIDQAIRAHGGEASGVVNRYLGLRPLARATLLRFVSHL
jgi:CxxC motif-containing protein (DUF1111 family)